MPIAVTEIVLVNALAIRNTTLQIPTATSTNAVGAAGISFDCRPYWEAQVKVESTLDQILAVQVYSNIGRNALSEITSALINQDTLGPQFFLPAGNATTTSQTRVMETAQGTMPLIMFVGLTAQITPTVGTVTVTLILSGLKPGF